MKHRLADTQPHRPADSARGGATAAHPGHGIAFLDNPSGLPAPLKSGIESLSGLPMDDVKVHYNSPRPAQLLALAYAQGSDIHLGPGQERRLPHEAWHVAQQKQGRVRETMRTDAGPVNDERGLEREAEGWEGRVPAAPSARVLPRQAPAPTPVIQRCGFATEDEAVLSFYGLIRHEAVFGQQLPAAKKYLDLAQEKGWDRLEHVAIRYVRKAEDERDERSLATIHPRPSAPGPMGLPFPASGSSSAPKPLAPPSSPAPESSLAPKPLAPLSSSVSESSPAPEPLVPPSSPAPDSSLAPKPLAPPSSSVPEMSPAPQPLVLPSSPAPESNLAPKPIILPSSPAPESSPVPKPVAPPLSSVPESIPAPKPVVMASSPAPERSPAPKLIIMASSPVRERRQAPAPAILPPEPKTRQKEAEELLTAHSPGVYTGPANALVPAVNATNFPYAASTGFHNPNTYTNSPTPAEALKVGGVANMVSGAADVVAMGRSIEAIHKARTTLNKPESTDAQQKLAKTQLKSAAWDLPTQAVDLGAQTSGLVGTFAASGSTVATQAAQAAPFLSVPVNAVVGVRAAWRAGRAWVHKRALNRLLPSGGGANEVMPLNAVANLAPQAEYARNQMAKRQLRQGIGAAGAALGFGGALALGIGAVAGGAALMATPFGWALAGAGALVALGLGAYKLYRYLKKGRNNLGHERRQRAHELHTALKQPVGDRNRAEAERIVRAMGLDPNVVRQEGGQDLLEEKLKSW